MVTGNGIAFLVQAVSIGGIMPLIKLIGQSTPALLGMLILVNVGLLFQVRQLMKELKDLKDSITWGDTCDERHQEISRRLGKLENGN